jgi:PGF-pre-PGF domain-containing protein
MMMGVRELRKVLVVLIMVLCLMPIGTMAATLTIGLAGGGQYASLEQATFVATAADDFRLMANVPVSMNITPPGATPNVTWLRRNLNLNNYALNVTNTSLGIIDTVQILSGNITIAGGSDSAQLWNFTNSSAIQISPGLGTLTVSNVWVNGTPQNAMTIVNVSTTSKTYNSFFNISVKDRSFGLDISGNTNTFNLGGTNPLAINTSGYGINLTGTGNTISLSSRNITANSGKIFIPWTSVNNKITDIDYISQVCIYNGSAPSSIKNVSAWYFFNRTWSTGQTNMNITINVSPYIPLVGNVNITANLSTVTGNYPSYTENMLTNQSLNITDSGYAGGFIYNKTENIIFASFPAIVPVNVTYGKNWFNGYYGAYTIGNVVVLNFNPVNSTTPAGAGSGQYFNITGTTNWTEITDFTNAQNITFVVDKGPGGGYTLLGNLSFLDPLDLTDPNTGAGLANLSTNLQMSVNGNEIKLGGNAVGMSALNKSAVLKVYPTNFVFTAGSTNIEVTADGTQLYNKGTWSGGATNYVTTAQQSQLTVGNGFITLPVWHFTTYDFGSGQNPSPGPAPDTGGGSSSPPSAVPQQQVQQQVVAETKTVTVNVGGESAVTKAEVTGAGLGQNFVVTSLPVVDLPASVTKAPTTVFQYDKVTTSTVPGTVGQITLQITVPDSWLAQKGFTKNDITLMQYNSNTKSWNAVPTKLIGDNGIMCTYVAGPYNQALSNIEDN